MAMFKQPRLQRQRKRSFSRFLNFAIVPIRSICTKPNYLGTELVETAFKLKKIMKNSPWSPHVLLKTLDLIILLSCFAKDGKEM